MQRAAIIALKILLVALVLILLVCQIWLIPNAAWVTGMVYPEVAYLEVPGIIVAVLFLVCVQVALACVWQLLTLVQVGVIFSRRSFIYVDTIIVLICIATAIAIAAFVGLIVLQIGSSAVIVCLLGSVLGLGSALLMLVMRGLIHKATQLEQDLAEVV